MTRTFLFQTAAFLAVLALPGLAYAQSPAENSARPAEASATPESIITPPTDGGLTADLVAKRAGETSHDIRAKHEESAAASYSVDQARAGFIPRLQTTARYTRMSAVDQASLGNVVVARDREGPLADDDELAAVPLSFPTPLNQYALTASLQLPLSDYVLRFPQLVASAEHNARAAQLLEQATRRLVATEARVVYYAWARAHLQAVVAERNLSQAQAHLKDAQAGQETGTVSKADVLRVEAQVANAELMLARARTAEDNYERQLRVVMHDSSGVVYELGEDLRSAPELPALARHNERELVALAFERRLEPQALIASAAGLREQAKAQRSAGLPRIDAIGNAQYANPNNRTFPMRDEFSGSWDATLQLSWTPTEIFGTEAGRSATLAKARKLDADRAALRDDIELEVRREYLTLKETEIALQSSERGLAAAEESYRVRRVMFQNGAATSVELTDAETEWSRAQLEVIGARIDRRIADCRLRHAVGDE